MSTEVTQPTEAEIEKLAAAQDVLMEKVYIPTFVKRCAELGHPLQTEEELAHALQMGVTLEALRAKKLAETQTFAVANRILAKQASTLGLDVGQLFNPGQSAAPVELPDDLSGALDALVPAAA